MTLRVLHCPWLVGGNAPQLARSEREIGLESRSVSYEPEDNVFGYMADEHLLSARSPRIWRPAVEFTLLARALRQYHIVHFNFGCSIFSHWRTLMYQKQKYTALERLERLYLRQSNMCDLPLLKSTGKGIVVTYQGDDARQGDYSLKHFDISIAQEVDYYNSDGDEWKRRSIAMFEKFADKIYYLNPDLAHVLPARAEFLPYAHIDLRDWQPVTQHNENPVVIHAPSHRGAKGTKYILTAVERLKNEGIPFEFILIENMKQSEARRAYQQADLLVDQLLAGWYGGLAVELMALGKPVMSYLRAEDLRYLPEQMRNELPIINATPATIYDVLKQWLTVERNRLIQMGLQSRTFVEKWHDPIRIAYRLKHDYERIRDSKLIKA